MARSLVATEIGVKRAKEALIDLGITQTVLAEKRLKYSRSTVSNFFNRKPIAHENFTEICKILKLEWRDIAGIAEGEATQDDTPESSATPASSKSARQEFKQIDDKVKQVEKQIRLAFAIAGTVDQVDQAKLTAILNLLRQITNDASVSIIDIQEGSIKLILTGTPEALEMIQALYESGELTEVEGIHIEYVDLLVDESEVARNQNVADLSLDLSEQFGSHPRMKVVEFNAGEKFFLMLVPNGSVEEAWNALDQGNIQDVQPIFSLVTASPTKAIQAGKIIDITGDGNNYIFKNIHHSEASERDFSDLIFQVKGAKINTSNLDKVMIENDEGNDGNDGDLIFGNAGDDLIHGDAGDDKIQGNDGNDLISGVNDNDTIEGNTGTDNIFGDAGDDTINGNLGNDIISGGSEKDLISGGEGNDTINGNDGNDFIFGNAGKDLIYGDAGADVISGGADDDTIYGNDGNDLIQGDSGNDTIYGGTGEVILSGNKGNDKIYGEDGKDLMHGNEGDDFLSGGNDDDILYGDAGNDILEGDAGDDLLFGGEGEDTMSGNDGNDTLFGEAGNDSMFGNAGDDKLAGGDGDDYLSGGTGKDFLNGQAGDDTLHGDEGDDVLYGEAGNDKLYGDDGDDYLVGGEGGDLLDGRAGLDTISYRTPNEGVIVQLSSSLNKGGDAEGDNIKRVENLEGSFYDDWLIGDRENNVIKGLSGDDRIDGKGTHSDHMLGIVRATQDNSIGIDGINNVNNFEQELKPTEDGIESESDVFSQVMSGYYTVEATGKVEFQLIADVSNYQGQLAVISMAGMENLDINSREFLQEALDRAIFGSEEKLGYIINEID